MRLQKLENYKLRYTYSSTDSDGEATRVARHFEFGSASLESASEVAKGHATTLNNDPNLDDFVLICPDGKEIKLDVSGVMCVDLQALELDMQL